MKGDLISPADTSVDNIEGKNGRQVPESPTSESIRFRFHSEQQIFSEEFRFNRIKKDDILW